MNIFHITINIKVFPFHKSTIIELSDLKQRKKKFIIIVLVVK